MTVYKLLPRHGIDCQVKGGNGLRFVRNFRAVWAGLPLRVRRVLLGGWREAAPEIRLRHKDGRFAAQAAFRVHECRDCFEFFAFYCEANSDKQYRHIIAHELAHCVQRACDWYTDSEWNRRSNEDAIEREADDMAKEWGF